MVPRCIDICLYLELSIDRKEIIVDSRFFPHNEHSFLLQFKCIILFSFIHGAWPGIAFVNEIRDKVGHRQD